MSVQQLKVEDTYTITGQDVAYIIGVLGVFPRNMDKQCQEIEKVLSEGLTEVERDEPEIGHDTPEN